MGSTMTTFDKLQPIIAATLKVAPAKITETTSDQDLPAWDSLGQVNLIMALEQEFGVYIEVEDFGNLNSVPAILAYLGQQGAS
jgi:acyl carrier protein